MARSDERAQVLYVDDEEHNLTVFRAAFDDDYDIHTAISAREAIQILKRQPIDLILTDQRMPQMTGVQFLEAIVPDHPDSIRMIVTGYTDIDAIIHAVNTGRIDRYITKPWEQGQLKLTLDRALQLQSIRRRNRQLVKELEARVKRATEIRKLFQKYVPETVVKDTLEAHARRDMMAGEARIVAVMFSTIQGFRSLASSLDAHDVVDFLNRYFGLMGRIVDEHQGFVAQFVSEEMLALFGAPVSSLENENNAVRAALAMVESLEAFNNVHAIPLLGRPIHIGVGVNRGEVITGNLGSPKRLQYGAVGDPVNVASRIKGQTRQDHDDVIVSGQVKEWLDETLALEPLGPVKLRGKDEPVELYRVIGKAPS